ncbi:MAG: hypothetical protein J0L77_04705 [Alphaproteobacteria bacterium]|nr:hypothetical protein [Alphaproteobacteria bacterium]
MFQILRDTIGSLTKHFKNSPRVSSDFDTNKRHAFIVDVFAPCNGGVAHCGLPHPAVTHEEILPDVLGDDRPLYYYFIDADGTESPKTYVGFAHGKDAKTGADAAGILYDDGSHYAVLLNPGDRMLNKEGQLIVEIPVVAKVTPPDPPSPSSTI